MLSNINKSAPPSSRSYHEGEIILPPAKPPPKPPSFLELPNLSLISQPPESAISIEPSNVSFDFCGEISRLPWWKLIFWLKLEAPYKKCFQTFTSQSLVRKVKNWYFLRHKSNHHFCRLAVKVLSNDNNNYRVDRAYTFIEGNGGATEIAVIKLADGERTKSVIQIQYALCRDGDINAAEAFRGARVRSVYIPIKQQKNNFDS